MEAKKTNQNLKKLPCSEEFQIKQGGGEAVFIEGFANKATIDRGDEIIATDAWDLDNFKKNPVILFNHGLDTLGGTPVGRATHVKETDDGLFIKVRMSNSQAPGISMVRDLVEERILKAFSVGFDPKETDSLDVDGKTVRKITKAELFEVSIVGVPMNQDSVFELSPKMLESQSMHQIKSAYLKARGSVKALEIENTFVDGQDRKATIEQVAEKLGIEVLDVKDMLAGNEEVSEEVYEAFIGDTKSKDPPAEKTLEEELAEAKAQVEALEAKLAEKTAGSEDDEDKEDEDDDEMKSEDGEGSAEKDFQECVNSKVPKLINEGKERDEAVAQAIAMCQEEGKCTLPEESKEAVYAACFSAADGWDPEGEKAFEIQLPEGFKFIPEEAQKQEGDGSQPPNPIDTDVKQDDFGSPFLDAAKQTNVLLGTLISEIQTLRSEMASQTRSEDLDLEEDKSKESDSEADGDGEIKSSEDQTKSTEDYASKLILDIDEKLKSLGH